MTNTTTNTETDTSHTAATVAVASGVLIDGTGADPVADAGVVIENGRIVDVGPTDNIEIPADSQRINAAGQTNMPGLVEGHTHMWLC